MVKTLTRAIKTNYHYLILGSVIWSILYITSNQTGIIYYENAPPVA